VTNRPEFLFAHCAVPALVNLRGRLWYELVREITALPEDDPNALAFALMMIDLNGCITCDARRYRERGGCASCACLTLKASSRLGETTLIARFHAAGKRIAEMAATQ
jgi:hypothetical protein